MRFAFLVHPLSRETDGLVRFDPDGSLLRIWGIDPAGVAARLNSATAQCLEPEILEHAPKVSVFDELGPLVSSQGSVAEGRIYQIPLTASQILENPDEALRYMEEAVALAAEWGARLVGLGSMTGIVGSRGEYLAARSPIAVTTGNSLTVYTALQNLFHVAESFDIDLKHETVAMVGVPGSIISGVAALAAPHCGKLLLVGRNNGTGAVRKLADQLGGEYLASIGEAVSQARVVVSATSSGGCIDQQQLLPGTVVIDVGVPTDVIGQRALRSDVLILTGGLTRVPEPMRATASRMLRFHHGVIPSCLAETLLLALDQRAECLSLGRELNLDSIQEIGMRARAHGFEFNQPYSFGLPLNDGFNAQFRKVRWRSGGHRNGAAAEGRKLVSQAAARHARHCSPVLHALGQSSGFVKTFVRGQGAYLYDAREQAYLDCVSGFGALNLGHNHPAVVHAISEALQQQAPGFVQSAVNPYQGA